MSDWKKQLQEAYAVIRDKKKAQKPDTSSRFDSEKNYKGRSGYNDVGLPITPKTIKQKNKNKSMYAARASAKYWSAGSQLRNINDRRAADARAKYNVPTNNKSVGQDSGNTFKVAPITRVNYPKFPNPIPRKKVYNYYDPIYQDDTIEVVPTTSPKVVRFKNKIEEAIFRLKNK
jgi:hypothetical protein